MIPIATFLSFRDALYFFRLDDAPSSGVLGAAPPHHGCWSTCAAVRRVTGSSSSSFVTRSFASLEILSHHGEGKSYLMTATVGRVGP